MSRFMVDGAAAARRRRFRRLRGSKRGVVSVVGTLLALLVFFSLFGIFLTEYVPLWMTDNESQWTAQMQASLAELQSNMNLQVALDQGGILSTPFGLSSDAVPLIAQPTAAILSFLPQTSGVFVNVSSPVGPGGSGAFYQNLSLGALRVVEQNRYFPAQTFEFENDAVIQSQTDLHQVITYPPPIEVNASGGTVGATVELIQMVGNATQAVSTGSEEVYSQFLDVQTYNLTRVVPFNVTLTEGTHYACAWSGFYANLSAIEGFPKAALSVTPSTCVASLQVPHDVVVRFVGVSYLRLIVANFQMVLGVGIQ